MTTNEKNYQDYVNPEIIEIAKCLRFTKPSDLRKDGDIRRLCRFCEDLTGIDPINGFKLTEIDEGEDWTKEALFQEKIRKMIYGLADKINNQKINDLRNDLDFLALLCYLQGLFNN